MIIIYDHTGLVHTNDMTQMESSSPLPDPTLLQIMAIGDFSMGYKYQTNKAKILSLHPL